MKHTSLEQKHNLHIHEPHFRCTTELLKPPSKATSTALHKSICNNLIKHDCTYKCHRFLQAELTSHIQMSQISASRTYKYHSFIFNSIFDCSQAITDSILYLGNCMVIRSCNNKKVKSDDSPLLNYKIARRIYISCLNIKEYILQPHG